LLDLGKRDHLPNNLIYKVIFKEEDLVEPVEPTSEFDLHDYFSNPHHYRSVFSRYLPHTSMLINCVYWDARYPRLVTKEQLAGLFREGRPKLTVVGDISCDVNGSVEFTEKATEIEDPIFVYDPFLQSIAMGHEGEGMLVMAVDILPSELPRDASHGFSDVLVNFVKPIADCDFTDEYEDLDLPRAVRRALILHNGELTPDYKYISEYLNDSES
jgi:alpha-aminoadipic semialdehyde synthase